MYKRRRKTVGVLSLALLIMGLDADSSQLQWINDSYLLVFAALLLCALVAGTAIFGLASLAALLVDTPEQLIGVRAVMGVGGALIMPATLSIISNVFPREERARAIAVWAGMASVGTGLGPLFGGLLLEWFDWRQPASAATTGVTRHKRG